MSGRISREHLDLTFRATRHNGAHAIAGYEQKTDSVGTRLLRLTCACGEFHGCWYAHLVNDGMAACAGGCHVAIVKTGKRTGFTWKGCLLTDVGSLGHS